MISFGKKKEKYIIFKTEYDVVLYINGDKQDEFTSIQRQAYIEFNKNKLLLTSQIEEKIFEYYQSVCLEYRDMYEDEADIYAPVIDAPIQLKELVKPQFITIPRSYENRIINILFKTKWDLEMGIGIRIVNENIKIVGVQSDVL